MNLFPENIVNIAAATTDEVRIPLINNHNIALDILRLDKIHPVISGNKWFKLRHYLDGAVQRSQQRVLTFGGAYSNHIIATACAASRAGLQSIGIIRGEKPETLSHTLTDAAQLGMQLVFISRHAYNQKNNPAFIERLQQEYDHPCIVPEGGEGIAGVEGAADIMQLTESKKYTHVLCAVGTATMLSGLVKGTTPHQQVVGIAVLKGMGNMPLPYIAAKDQARTTIVTDYHFGGYAKKNNVLIDSMNNWYDETGIPADFVYTGKLFFALTDLLKKGYFPATSRLLVIHSGGLQGNKSLPPKTLHF